MSEHPEDPRSRSAERTTWSKRNAATRPVVLPGDFDEVSTDAVENYVSVLGWETNETLSGALKVWTHPDLGTPLVIPSEDDDFAGRSRAIKRVVDDVAGVVDVSPVEVALGIAATAPRSSTLLANVLQSWFGPTYLFRADDGEVGVCTPYAAEGDRALAIRIFLPGDESDVWTLNHSTRTSKIERDRAQEDVRRRGLDDHAWTEFGVIKATSEGSYDLPNALCRFVQHCVEINVLSNRDAPRVVA